MRTHRLQIRLTEKESDTIRKNANCAGLSMSEYVRKRIANQNVIIKPAPEWFSVQHKLNGITTTYHGQVPLLRIRGNRNVETIGKECDAVGNSRKR